MSAHTAVQHQEVLPHPVPICRTDLPFFVKPLAKDPLITHNELAIVIKHHEHDLVGHALIDPKPYKFSDVDWIEFTFPIVWVSEQMGGWSHACHIAKSHIEQNITLHLLVLALL